jgi:DNA-binding LacI/PurR family transcriptional regulator
VLSYSIDPAHDGAIWGAPATAQKLGAIVSVLSPSIPDDVGQQIEIVERMIDERPDAIILLPAHHTDLNGTIEAVHRAGIPLVLVVSRPQNARAVTFVTSDDRDMAYRVGTLLADDLSVGNVAIIMGPAVRGARTSACYGCMRPSWEFDIHHPVHAGLRRANGRARRRRLVCGQFRRGGVVAPLEVGLAAALDLRLDHGPVLDPPLDGNATTVPLWPCAPKPR